MKHGKGFKRENNPSWKNDLQIGMKFYRWTIVDIAPSYEKNRQSRWICECECGTTKIVASANLRTGKSKSCGCFRSEYLAKIKSKEFPVNSRRITESGYVEIRIKNKKGKCVAIKEHRYVMSQFLGRDLLPEEDVHHKNGVRDDNRIDNLELWSHSHPSGQRIPDLIKWAHEILTLYEKD